MQKIPRKVILNGTEILNLDSTSATISDVADGKAYYNINGYLVEGTDEDQPTELEALTVTDNGVFTPETEGLDIAGWNYVRVDVEKGTELPDDYASKEYVQEEIRDINAIVLNNKLYLTKDGEIFTEGTKLPTGGGGGSTGSVITLTNLLPSMVVTAAKGNDAILKFSYSSAEYSGDGAAYIYINQELKEVRTISTGENIIPISNLSVGTSSVEIKCMDIYSNSKSITYTVKIVDMYIQSSFSDTNLFKNNILYVYKAFGSIDKKVHFLLDGEDIPGTPVNALASTSGDESSQEIGILTHGVHTLQVYSDAYIENDYISSDKLNYDLVCAVEGNKTPLLASSYNVTSCKEGEYVNIPYFIYDPDTTECEVTLTITKVGEETPYLIETRKVAQQKQFWRTNKFPIGTVTFTITYVPVSTEFEPLIKEYRIEVSQGDIPGAIGSPILYLSSEGRSNQQSNRELWTYQQSNGNIIDTTFSNMNWKTTGWVDDTKDPKVPGETALRLNGKASAEINFKPFETTAVTSGLTLELEFAIRDVNNRDATVIECKYGKVGFIIKANQAEISNGADTLSCYFKDEEKVRISFVICNNKEGDGDSLMYIYLNGVMSSVKQYTSNFSQATPSTIKIGSSDCGIDIYTIRCYQMGLDRSSIVKNYIADTRKLEAKIDLNSDNNIYENKKVSYSLVTERIPTMTITGRLPVGEDDKFDVKISYRDCFEPSLNFDESCSIQVQGTSSLAYPVKNYKLKFSKTIQHAKNQLPAKVFCLKADYAEATGTHNTQNANFVETLYDNDHKTPAQQDEPKCRTTIYGFPCVIFHKATSDSEPVFIGKYNFNYDKGSENVFGFEKKYDVECWEFGTNIDDACMFRKEIPENFYGIFEPRCYYANVDNETVQALGYLSLDDLHDKIGDELDDLGKAYTETPDVLSDAEKQHFKDISNASIARFKQMHDWVRSTDTKNATNSVFAEQKIINGEVFKSDTDKYRLAKFKAEFEEYFDKYYCLIYYVYTFVALMVDQRAKNMFLTYWGDTQKWQPWFYDNDTCFGIDNEGELKFDYYHEDYSGDDELDKYGAEYVYAGRNSVLWYNFSQAFATDIKKMYTDLRSNNKITYDTLIDYFITNGSNRWSENLYNEDGEVKYIRQLKDYNNGEHLKRLRGTGEEHLRYFLENRIKYCDSKWDAGDYKTNNVHLRINKPAVWQGVEPRLALTITPYSNFYAGVVYSQGTGLRVTYVKKNVATELAECDSTEVTNIETDIYGASEISDLGDLAPLYCGTVDVSKATKLKSLKIGSNATGYKNESLQQVSLGANVLLQDIDIRNCVNMNDTLRLAQCPNIKNIYAGGSAITQVELPEAGYLETLELPATITKLKLTNQSISNGFSMEGSGELTDLWIENCPNINSLNIIKNAPKLDYITLTNIDWTLENDSLLQKIYSKKGYAPENKDEPIDHGYLTGQCHVSIITQTSLDKYKQAWPSLKITYDAIGVDLIFMSEDGTAELYRQTVNKGGNGTDPVENGIITAPTKPSTAQYYYDFSGWSRTQGSNQASDTALNNILEDTYVYLVYRAIIRTYSIKFYNGTSLLQSVLVEYGKIPQYTGSTPTDNTQGDFIGWEPEIVTVTGSAEYYAKFAALSIPLKDINYTLDYDNLTLTVTKYNGSAKAIEIPETYAVNGIAYTVTAIGDEAFRGRSTITKVVLGENSKVTSIGTLAFYGCSLLESITLPETLTNIDINAFYNCRSLKDIKIPKGVTNIGDSAFRDCNSLTSVVIPDGVTVVKSSLFYSCKALTRVQFGKNTTAIQSSAFYSCSSLEEIIIPDSVTTIGDKVFSGCKKLNEIKIPEGINIISNNLFENCTSLVNVELPSTIAGIYGYAFYNCTSLKNITLPEGLKTILGPAFAGAGLTSIKLPKSLTSVSSNLFYNCDNLVNIEVDSENYLYSSINGNLYNKDGTVLLQYARGKTDSTFVVPNISTISDGAFSGSKQIINVIIPDTVATIGTNAFEGCSALKSVTISKNITRIDAYVFYNCTSLTSITIPDKVLKIGVYAFGGCIALQSVIFGENSSLTTINDYAFEKCSALTEINIPSNVSSIAAYAFKDCSSLINITMSDTLSQIGRDAFYNCSSLINIKIPDSLTSIEQNTFYNCKKLTNIVIPKNVLTIKNYAFGNCTGLTSVIFEGVPNTLTGDVFYGTLATLTINVPWPLDYVANAPWGATTATINYDYVPQ